MSRSPIGQECVRCFTFKWWSDFKISRRAKSGYTRVCKTCVAREQANATGRDAYTPTPFLLQQYWRWF